MLWGPLSSSAASCLPAELQNQKHFAKQSQRCTVNWMCQPSETAPSQPTMPKLISSMLSADLTELASSASIVVVRIICCSWNADSREVHCAIVCLRECEGRETHLRVCCLSDERDGSLNMLPDELKSAHCIGQVRGVSTTCSAWLSLLKAVIWRLPLLIWQCLPFFECHDVELCAIKEYPSHLHACFLSCQV